MLILLTGGARSGKSTTALRLATARDAPVVFVATAEAGDDEMADRIERHRAERPVDWTTIEAPREPSTALAEVDPDASVIFDCLSLWITNVLDRDDSEIEQAVARLGGELSGRAGLTVVVTNEVGSGIVPDNALSRRFRDLLGAANQTLARVSDHAYLCVAGGVVEIRELDAASFGRHV